MDALIPQFKITFFNPNGRLVRRITVAEKCFTEQFDWDGWYSYHAIPCDQIDKERAIDLALAAIQVMHPNYINRAKASFKLYEFDLSQLSREQLRL